MLRMWLWLHFKLLNNNLKWHISMLNNNFHNIFSKILTVFFLIQHFSQICECVTDTCVVCFSEDPDRPSEYTPLIHWGRLQTTRVCVGDRFIAGCICRFPGIILMPQWLNLNKPLFLCANCSGMDHLVQYLPCMAFLLPGRKLGKHNVQANFENDFIMYDYL